MSDPNQSGGAWTLLTGHGHVLVEIARNPDARIRDISPVVGLTERSVQAIVADLEAAGYLTRARTGRRVVYSVNRDSLFRHSAQDGAPGRSVPRHPRRHRDRDHTQVGRSRRCRTGSYLKSNRGLTPLVPGQREANRAAYRHPGPPAPPVMQPDELGDIR
jgi:hypothetical protein